MDGTGELFKRFVSQLPLDFDAKVVSYPQETYQTYEQTAQNVRNIIPLSAPYVIIAESYSGPVASLVAENSIGNIRAVVLVSSFVSLPWGRAGTWISKILPTFMFRLRPPDRLLRWLLMESTSSAELISEAQEAISRVPAKVLAKRTREALNADFSQPLRNSNVRVICLQPNSDRLLNAQSYRRLTETRTNIETIKIDGPHFLLQCAPERCWASLQKIGLFDT